MASTSSENKSMSEQGSNKRIAKNTLMLYFRMFLMMAIGLFTSRVLLHALGASDLGIYNVIGGVVAMFTMFNGTLASASQRFITFALGEGDTKKLKTTFSMSLTLHIILAAIVFVLIETIGVWFLYNKMVIPGDRMNAAFWLLQFSAFTCALDITQVPYDACVVAHERMGVFAYFSILDAFFKLAITYAVWAFGGDKLILYGFLLMCVSWLMRIIYRVYSIRHFEEAKYHRCWDKKILKDMSSFFGWNTVGTVASTLSGQGFNLMLNTFFGTIVNAAMNITNQVNRYVTQFVGNFQTAVNPQITKLYASNEIDKMHKLVGNASLFSAYIMLYMSIPIILEIDFILKIWLGYGIPQYTSQFVQIIMVQNVITTMSRPLVTEMQAIGKLRIPALGNGTVLMLILPFSYVFLRLGVSPVVAMAINVIPWIWQLFFENWFVSSQTNISPWIFIRRVILKVVVIGLACFTLSYLAGYFMPNRWLNLIAVCLTSTISLSVIIYNWGMDKHIRDVIINKLLEKLHISHK